MKIAFVLLFASAAAAWPTKWTDFHLKTFSFNALENNFSNERIIGGGYANVGEFPYQAAVIIDGIAFCGGSLVSDYTILTAARCIVGGIAFEVHLGSTNLLNFEPTHIQVTSTETVVHSGWDPYTNNNDIAVIQLPIVVGGLPGISAIRLPAPTLGNLEGIMTRASGWGMVDSTPFLSQYLKYVDLTVISNAECAITYGSDINAAKLCTSSVATGGGAQGTCSGDTGGPLVMRELDNSFTQVGIISFGSPNGCESLDPDVFTRLSMYVTWLQANVRGQVSIRS